MNDIFVVNEINNRTGAKGRFRLFVFSSILLSFASWNILHAYVEISSMLTNNRLEIISEKRESRPRLFLHVGPLKTGTTSLQNQYINAEKYRKHLHTDKFKLIDLDYIEWGQLEKCFPQDRQHRVECEAKIKIRTVFEEAYNNSIGNSSQQIYTLFSREALSNMPERMVPFMEDLLEKWDLTVIMFYRPFYDWLPSMYAQSRKYNIARPGRVGKQFFKEEFNRDDQGQMTFPDYFRKNTHEFRDTLGTYQFFKSLLRRRSGGGRSSSSSSTEELTTNQRDDAIRVLPLYSPNGIGVEFFCNLPHAERTCHVTKREEVSGGEEETNQRSRHANKSDRLPLHMDLLVMEAWARNLISIPRHAAAVALAERLRSLSLLSSETNQLQLPMVCISKGEEEWIWNRTFTSEQMFGSKDDNGFLLRQTFESALSLQKFCSVNATAAFENATFREILNNDCTFQSKFFLRRSGRHYPYKVNPKWEELGCVREYIMPYT